MCFTLIVIQIVDKMLQFQMVSLMLWESQQHSMRNYQYLVMRAMFWKVILKLYARPMVNGVTKVIVLRKVLFVFVCLFDLILYVPPTIFQLNRDESSWVPGLQRSDASEARTDSSTVSSQALYHWATALPRKVMLSNTFQI